MVMSSGGRLALSLLNLGDDGKQAPADPRQRDGVAPFIGLNQPHIKLAKELSGDIRRWAG